MRKWIKESVITLLQGLLFYLLPLLSKPDGAIGMVVLLLLSAVVTAFVLGAISENRIKFLYPVAIAVLFLPSVFLYYNETAFVHSLWYLVASAVGIGLGSLVRMLTKGFTK